MASTELVYVDGSGSVKAGPLLNVQPNYGVTEHGLVTVDLPEPKVFSVGGVARKVGVRPSSRTKKGALDTVEEWQPLTKTWKTTELKTHTPVFGFGYLAVNYDLVCP